MAEDLPPEPDREGDLPHPRETYELFGQEEAERQAAQAFESGRMHHAWMITGPKGVGKATFAWRLTRRALGAVPAGEAPLGALAEDPVCRRLEVLSHPDFLLIRRPYDDKRGKLRAEITVDESRRAPEFFSKSASGRAWRVCIVDAADEMNTNAANALLKTLEEPPAKGLLLLVTHAPGRLPTTIRSRCRRLVLRAPAEQATADWLVQRHGFDADHAARCAGLAGGAPGRALALGQSEAPKLKDTLDRVLSSLPRLDSREVGALAAQTSKKEGEAVRNLLMEFLERHAQERARSAALEAGEGEAAGIWVQAADALARLARESETLYLDPKQTVHAAFSILRDAAQATR
ncbi:DNA polymerase III subunit delta' [Marinicauda algicola]|uniref:DNA polymerase III subunit delta n=1 Tax=Marinicauda algicola TaxID=2029849 RepID=A0A4S2GYR1_9PROT|nr:DNA polymerase III subunit delta' [Marinicauda algicola]TGY87922.1 DNA polymerase III subunit delta' [Marinicauda algicola]